MARRWLSYRRVYERRFACMCYFHSVACVGIGMLGMQVLLRDYCIVMTFRRFAAVAIQAQWRRFSCRKRHFAK